LRRVNVREGVRRYGRCIRSASEDPIMSQLNVGNFDRVLRIVLGFVLIGLAVTGVVGAWGYLGLVPLLTGIAARCPLYAACGVSTTVR